MNAVAKASEHRVYLSLGSNIEPEINLPEGIARLAEACRLVRISRVWETAPAYTSGPNFLNAACLLVTGLSASDLKLKVLRLIEEEMGRVRSADKNAPRPIDLDIIIYDDVVLEPRIWAEAFLAIPLADLLPDLKNSASGETLKNVAHRFESTSAVKLRPEVKISIKTTRP